MRRITSISIICLLTSYSVFAAFSGGDGTVQNPYLISSKADMDEWTMKNQSVASEYEIFAYDHSGRGGGSISPYGLIFVPAGGSQTFTFTPSPGYELFEVLIDGVHNRAAGSIGSYTFNNVNAEHTISVSFSQKGYTQQEPNFSGGNGTPQNPYLISSRKDMELLATTVNEGNSYKFRYFRLTRDLTSPDDTVSTIIGGRATWDSSDNWERAFWGVFDGNGHEIAVRIRTDKPRAGLFGSINEADISNLCVSGNIEWQERAGSTYPGSPTIGGICGYLFSSNIDNCCNIANITTITTYLGGDVGGICGKMEHSLLNFSGKIYCSISNSYNTGDILGGHIYGGICGEISSGHPSTIFRCYNTGDISGEGLYGGGIIGNLGVSGSINDCYNMGNISGGDFSTCFLGGIYGYCIQSSYNSPVINDCYNVGHITTAMHYNDQIFLGGICGANGSISNCFVVNTLITNDSPNPNAYIGRVAGGWLGTYYNCYAESSSVYLNGNTISNNNSNSNNGQDLSLANLQNQSWIQNNLGWDFQTVWEMSSIYDPIHKGLPVLTMKGQIYEITATAGAGGTISPSGNISVAQGTSQTFTFTPSSRYEIDQVLIDGINNPTAVSAGYYTFLNVTANHSIAVTFKQKQVQTYLITSSAGSGGTISPSGNISVAQGTSQTFTFTPSLGYEIDQVLIDGVNNPTAVSTGSYTFNNINVNHTIYVTFKQKGTQQNFSGGDGTMANPYLISSREDMELLAAKVNEGNSYYLKFFKLTRDLIHSDDTVSTIIGSSSSSRDFSGSFDGNGHEIAVRIHTAKLQVGLFGSIKQAHIANLCVSGTIESHDDTTRYAGGICGFMYQSDIHNCCNTADITIMGYANVGGICGSFDGNCSISNSYNTGYIKGQGNAIGGICGVSGGSGSSNISRCYNTGNISGSIYCGGIIGQIGWALTISDCYNMGIISSNYNVPGGDLGGICGNNYWAVDKSFISRCYNAGYIAAVYPNASNLGGICGSYGRIIDCFIANSMISNESYNLTIGRIGGLNGSYYNCYAASSSVYLNGNTISNNNSNSSNGQDISLANLQNQSWIQNNLGWDFQTVWEMSSIYDPVHKGLPILKGINNITGTPAINQNESVSVYIFPNPAKDELFFKSDNLVKKLEIYNISGSRVFVKKNIDDRINISNLPNGMYILKIYTEKEIVTRKILKK
jgi:hypothetical protein